MYALPSPQRIGQPSFPPLKIGHLKFHKEHDGVSTA